MKKNELIAAVIVCVATVLLYLLCDPQHSSWMPACPFFRLTGWQCPVCGAQRMMHALLHLRLAEAFRYNAALLVSLPYFAFLAIGYLLRRRSSFVYDRLLSSRALLVYCLMATVWGIVRNI